MTFQPGDLVRVVDDAAHPGKATNPELFGAIATVIGPAIGAVCTCGRAGVSIKLSAVIAIACPLTLRKIDPPDDSRKITSWDECPWRPAVTA